MAVRITRETLNPAQAAQEVRFPEFGAVVTFEGCIRSTENDKPISAVQYEAYESMALKKLQDLAEECRRRFQAETAIHHRVGRVGTGEASVVVSCAACHREEAFEACQFAMDEIKAYIPIWKTEFLEAV